MEALQQSCTHLSAVQVTVAETRVGRNARRLDRVARRRAALWQALHAAEHCGSMCQRPDMSTGAHAQRH